MAAQAGVVTAGPHFSRFTETHCHHTMQVPGGPPPGTPLVLEEWQREFLDEALELRIDPISRQLVYTYRTVLLVIPRKNGKTTVCGALSLYSGGPWEGEIKPSVILAAGSREQAGELFGHATAFIDDPAYGSDALRSHFRTFKNGIVCPQVGGSIKRVAGDGKLNHSLNPHKVIADELHVWVTPRQLENWKALTTAQGARVSPQVVGLTTAGEDPDGMLGQLLARVREVCDAEQLRGVESENGFSGLTVYRNRRLGILVYEYAIAPGTPVDDLDAWKAANPASWRTPERIQADLEDPTTDEPTKRRLYGNEWTQAKDALFAAGVWERLQSEDAQFTDGEPITVGVDASLSHDCTAVGYARLLPDGRIAVKARVYATRRDAPAHRHFKGGRIKHAVVERFVAGELLHEDDPRLDDEPADLFSSYQLEALGYDPRYFNRSAELLADEGLDVVEYTPSAQPIWDAVQDFFNAVQEGTVCHDGDEVLAAHVRAAAGQKTDRGWKVSKLKTSRPIDALIAVIMAHDLARIRLHDLDHVMAFGPEGQRLEPSEEEIDALLGLIRCFGCGEPTPPGICVLCGHDNNLEDEEDDEGGDQPD